MVGLWRGATRGRACARAVPQCTTVPRRSRRTRRGGGGVATVPSLCDAEVLCTGAALTLHAARRAAAAAGSGGVDLRLRCVDLVSRPLFRPLPFFFITVTDIKGLVLDRQNSYFGYTKVGFESFR